MRACLLLTVLLGATSVVHAGNYEVTIGAQNRFLRTSSANAVTTDNLGGGYLGASRVLGLDLYPNLEIWATAGFAWDDADGTLFQTMTTKVDAFGFTLGGRARYSLNRYIHVSGRLDLGPAHQSLTLEANGHTVSDGAWGGTVTAALGLDMMVLVKSRFALGFRLDLGYVAATGVALSPREEGDASKIALDEMQASIGHLDLGGRFFAFSVLSQF